ncbi:glutamate ABC transporter substrate-binding protein [Streptomyces sp. BI20]|uniref:glutamate ABC transporter substrate-binding protein n=1 Tax=Streptomyces sp. BI20 TaxID=3403460 RepID=UPI003C747810
MRVPRIGLVAGAIALAVTTSGCSLWEDPPPELITIGIKYDQPGVGFREPDGRFTGLDADVARYVAKELGYGPDQVRFKEVTSSDRELLLQFGEVDLVVASYSISDKRRKKVTFAGPYFTAHQDLLVRTDNKDIIRPEDLNEKRLCSVTGSTSAENVRQKLAPKAALVELGNYSDCVVALGEGVVDAVTTDDAILAGFAARPEHRGKFRLLGLRLSDEKYGIGIDKKDPETRGKVNDALRRLGSDGSWQSFVKRNFEGASYRNEPMPPVTETR